MSGSVVQHAQLTNHSEPRSHRNIDRVIEQKSFELPAEKSMMYLIFKVHLPCLWQKSHHRQLKKKEKKQERKKEKKNCREHFSSCQKAVQEKKEFTNEFRLYIQSSCEHKLTKFSKSQK